MKLAMRILTVILCFTVMASIWGQVVPVRAEENDTRIVADNGELEIQVTSIDSSSYPQIKVYFTLSVPNSNLEPMELVSTYDLTTNFQNFIKKYPEYRGNQIPVTFDHHISLEFFSGTMYIWKYYLMLGDKNDENKQDTFRMTIVIDLIDLARWWPIDFVNDDLTKAANYVAIIRDKLKRPKSMELLDATFILDKDIPNGRFYRFNISAENSYGDPVEETYYAFSVGSHSSIFRSSDHYFALSLARRGDSDSISIINLYLDIVFGEKASKDNLLYFEAALATPSYDGSVPLDTSSILEIIGQ